MSFSTLVPALFADLVSGLKKKLGVILVGFQNPIRKYYFPKTAGWFSTCDPLPRGRSIRSIFEKLTVNLVQSIGSMRARDQAWMIELQA
jgi:hypothetical protein